MCFTYLYVFADIFALTRVSSFKLYLSRYVTMVEFSRSLQARQSSISWTMTQVTFGSDSTLISWFERI